MASRNDAQTLENKIPKNCHRVVHFHGRYCFTYHDKPPTEENKCPYLCGPANSFQPGVYYCKNETENLVLRQQKFSQRKR